MTTQPKPFFYKPFFIPPKADIFAERAIRFDELATQAAEIWSDYLRLLAKLCRAQHIALHQWQHAATLPETPHPTLLPPSDGTFIPPLFPQYLQTIIRETPIDETPTIQANLHKLTTLHDTDLAQHAKHILQHQPIEPQYTIWIHAALQCAWTAWASLLHDEHITSPADRSFCPCCGSDPVASVVLNGGDLHGLRYLHCSICNSRWNALRAQCTFCNDQSDMTFTYLDGEHTGALHGARAEHCGKCGHYRKLFLLEKQQYADPIADDLASLALDIMLGNANVQRGGENPFLLNPSPTTTP